MILKKIIITDNQFVVPKIYIYIFKLYLNLRNPKIIFFIAQLSLLFSLVQEIIATTKTSPTRPTKISNQTHSILASKVCDCYDLSFKLNHHLSGSQDPPPKHRSPLSHTPLSS